MNQAYRLSRQALAMAFVALLLIPAVLYLVDDREGTWDQLPDQLNIIVGGSLVAAACLLVSFAAALFCWRQRKIVLLWMIPIGIAGLVALGSAGVALIAPYWPADWL